MHLYRQIDTVRRSLNKNPREKETMSRVTVSRILQLDPEPSTALAAILKAEDP